MQFIQLLILPRQQLFWLHIRLPVGSIWKLLLSGAKSMQRHQMLFGMLIFGLYLLIVERYLRIWMFITIAILPSTELRILYDFRLLWLHQRILSQWTVVHIRLLRYRLLFDLQFYFFLRAMLYKLCLQLYNLPMHSRLFAAITQLYIMRKLNLLFTLSTWLQQIRPIIVLHCDLYYRELLHLPFNQYMFFVLIGLLIKHKQIEL
jgi:hypothetical protein